MTSAYLAWYQSIGLPRNYVEIEISWYDMINYVPFGPSSWVLPRSTIQSVTIRGLCPGSWGVANLQAAGLQVAGHNLQAAQVVGCRFIGWVLGIYRLRVTVSATYSMCRVMNFDFTFYFRVYSNMIPGRLHHDFLNSECWACSWQGLRITLKYNHDCVVVPRILPMGKYAELGLHHGRMSPFLKVAILPNYYWV